MSVFGAPFVAKIDGADVEFPLYTMKEYEGLQNLIRASLKQQNRTLADEVGLVGMDRARFLQERDPRSISLSEIDTFLADDVWSRKVLTVSLSQAGKAPTDIEELLKKVSVVDRGFVAKVVAGLITLSATESASE